MENNTESDFEDGGGGEEVLFGCDFFSLLF
jgi:hypothetical protein